MSPLLVAKEDDRVVGQDIHKIIPPTGPTLLIPHPFSGPLQEKLSSFVFIGGKALALKGSVANNSPQHIPLSAVSFETPPENKGEVEEGSQFVFCNDTPIARQTDRVTTCNDVGFRYNSQIVIPTGFVYIDEAARPAPEAEEDEPCSKGLIRGFLNWFIDHFSLGNIVKNLIKDVVTMGIFALLFAAAEVVIGAAAVAFLGNVLLVVAALAMIAMIVSHPKCCQAVGALIAETLYTIALFWGATALKRAAMRLPGFLKALWNGSREALGSAKGWFKGLWEGGEREITDVIEKEAVKGAVPKWPSENAKNLLKEMEALGETATPQEKRELSEKFGNEAAKQHLRERLGKNIPDKDFKTFEGRSTVNIFYKDPDTGKIYVLEAKGSASGGTPNLGSAQGKSGQVTQGSNEYLDHIADQMAESPDLDKNMAADEILRNRKQVEYIGVKGRYDPEDPTSNIYEPEVLFEKKYGE